MNVFTPHPSGNPVSAPGWAPPPQALPYFAHWPQRVAGVTFVLLACKPAKYIDIRPSRQNVSLCINGHNGDLCVSRHFSKSTQNAGPKSVDLDEFYCTLL